MMIKELECGFDTDNKTDADIFREMVDKCEIQNEQIETRDILIQKFQIKERELLSELTDIRERAEKAEAELQIVYEANSAWKRRAEAAEQRIRESQEQEPIAYYSDGCSYIAWVPTDNCELPLYSQPIIPPEVEELQREKEKLTRKLAKLKNDK